MKPKMIFLILLAVALVMGVLFLSGQEMGTGMQNLLDRIELVSKIDKEKDKDKKKDLMKRLRALTPAKENRRR